LRLFSVRIRKLRCFVRPCSQLARLEKALSQFDDGENVELVTRDLLSRQDCRKAAEGVSMIYHLAAEMEKSFAGAFMNSALATLNVIYALASPSALSMSVPLLFIRP